ncbi:MAG TPA: oxidoreductase [Nitrospirae bacterium]|nr:oxidoreductase [Nitrospirota bacterium]HDO23054.1 oxidoreductase [Nitrospirota bacterium]HDZ87278.1 oxidoreductase [Nitrospirota bacterium]
MVQAAQWTVKEGFVFPNEFIYWSIQIVMYPFTTGLVAGAFVLSSLYHVFGIEDLKDLAKFSLVFSFALLVAAPLPLLFHLEQPQRGIQIFFTPHFTSAIAAFGIVFFSYAIIVCSEIWFVYRKFFVEEAITYRKKEGFISRFKWLLYTVLTLGAFDISKEAINKDKKIIKWLAGIGIPVACFLHGYAGFIFGSVKANALWMTPLMPVIFIMSAIVSGIALCMLTYILIMEIKKMKILMMKKPGEVLTPQNLKGVEMDMISKTTKYLIGFMIAAMTLEILDLIFRGYTAVKTWDILRSVIYGKDAVNIFFLQYTVGNLIPFIILLLPKPNVPRMIFALSLVLFGVFMMRWNVVIGGQSFSLTFAGYMHYHMPIIPHNLDTFKEGLGGALISGFASFVFFWVINKFVPSIETAE